MMQVFESRAEVLSPDTFDTFSLPYLNQIAKKVKTRTNDIVPMTVFAKGGPVLHAIKALSTSSYDVISIDWTTDPKEARKVAGDKVLQGNLDPSALQAPEDSLDMMA